MLLRHMRPLSERGDTIVEVLIAIAVISLVLAGAFVMTNNSLQATRDTQEHLNATNLAEGQLEQLRALPETDPTKTQTIFGAVNPAAFCMLNGTEYTSSSTNCAVSTAGTPTTAEPVFHLSITRAGTNTFTTAVTWFAISGHGKDNVQLIYRVYQS
jgi:prepilin-type N-terminal cleavage/methylation domain-containing protein